MLGEGSRGKGEESIMHGGKGYFSTSLGFMFIFFCVSFLKDLSRGGSLFGSWLGRLGHVVVLFLDLQPNICAGRLWAVFLGFELGWLVGWLLLLLSV